MARVTLLGALALSTGCKAPGPQAVQRPSSEPQASTAEAAPQPSSAGLDRMEQAITHRVRATAAWVDAFLSDERSLAEGNRSWVGLRLDGSVQEREGLDGSVRLAGRFILPRTEDRLHMAFGGEPDVPESTDVPMAEETDKQVQNPDLALQFVLVRTRSNDIRPEAGVRIHSFEADPFAGLRWRHTEPLGTWVMRVTERLRAYVDDGPESRTTLDMEHLLFDTMLFRSSTRGIWRDEEPGYEYGQHFTVFKQLDSTTLLSLDWDTAFDTELEEAVQETTVGFRLSRRFAQNRLLVEIAPNVAWPQDLDYEPVLGLFVRVQVDFGRDE